MKILQYQSEEVYSNWQYRFSLFKTNNVYTELSPTSIIFTQENHEIPDTYDSFLDMFIQNYNCKQIMEY